MFGLYKIDLLKDLPQLPYDDLGFIGNQRMGIDD